MMKKWLIFLFVLCVTACATQNPLKEMRFQTISSGDYTLAAWYKITDPGQPLKVYIEGDGHSFNLRGQPTSDPTPQSVFLREIAAQDTSPNVLYLARPCQYLMSKKCSQKDWTSGRFSKEIIDSMDDAISQMMKKAKTSNAILIGYSGGGMVASLIAVRHPDQIKKLMTIAGVLDHEKWTSYHGDQPLTDSINLTPYLETFKTIPQVHFVGKKDMTVPWKMTQEIVGDDKIIFVNSASHGKGFESIYKDIWGVR